MSKQGDNKGMAGVIILLPTAILVLIYLIWMFSAQFKYELAEIGPRHSPLGHDTCEGQVSPTLIGRLLAVSGMQMSGHFTDYVELQDNGRIRLSPGYVVTVQGRSTTWTLKDYYDANTKTGYYLGLNNGIYSMVDDNFDGCLDTVHDAGYEVFLRSCSRNGHMVMCNRSPTSGYDVEVEGQLFAVWQAMYYQELHSLVAVIVGAQLQAQ